MPGSPGFKAQLLADLTWRVADVKGIVWGYLIFSASTKTNCWILELCIWLVRKLIGLPLLKRTPHQSKAEACYRQITCFYKKTYEPVISKTMILRESTTVYVTYETHKNK